MSKVQTLRVVVKQRLTAAAEEIFELFERTIAEYEEELCRHRKLLDAVLKPQVQLHRTDVQRPSVSEEEDPPEQQESSSSLDQEEPEPPHIKEEQEELWTNQEGEQLPGLEEADITKFTFTPVPVKSEDDDEEEPQSSQKLLMETEADGEDFGEPEPAWNCNPDSHLQSAALDEMSHSSEPETDDDVSGAESNDRCDWEETREPQPGSNCLQDNDVSVSNETFYTGETSVNSSDCATSFGHEGQEHDGIPAGAKPFICPVCGKSYHIKNSLNTHMRSHSGGRFSCSECKKTFHCRRYLVNHMRTHTGEKPFSCSVCGTRFAKSSTLKSHLRVHTGEKPFTCSVCKASFSHRYNLATHMRIHTGEKPFRCSVCGKRFTQLGSVRRHSIVHTREKPFSCSFHMDEHKCVDECSREAC
ncbi:zinc finger protein 135-like isoform X1 [Acanthopagrus latus]|uniref:zinc finger protein 135-like isoform X1 n=1 Tax=Acanthopagrus latus TaxID=8177 RepID=UPI00187C67A3|nr:zinc finger protein 135-like isoform X1 [Acanthopagrus latus]